MAQTLEQILSDVACGKLTPEQGEAAIEQLDRSPKSRDPFTGAVDLTAEGLQAFAETLDGSCRSMERNLKEWTQRMDRDLHQAEARLRQSLGQCDPK